ncbi:VOC family protein [Sorangium atrum]|uniref:VOC family protein n=1 Tax=Sorangium atrum TaxID=2995308 RepID=A0ABT5CAF8_9BACT|nr:VOC family protein [Sorangium aterium]MDC0683415.1 VOC family protein [Sorangium aterium]
MKIILKIILMLVIVSLGGCISHTTESTSPMESPNATSAVVRYQVTDVDRAVRFYTERLGFTLDLQAGTAFATVSRGDLRLLLSGPGSSGARPMPDGRAQVAGGWNRIVLYVDDLATIIERLRAAGTPFRNDIESGVGGAQIQLEDPDGNPVELHEAPEESTSAAGNPDATSAVVRYQNTDVDRAARFYTEQLGFTLDLQSGTAFATVSRGDLRLLLSGPGSSGARPMPDGRAQTAGGWNRIVLYVDDFAAIIERLRAAETPFRNDIERGMGGAQIQLEDPDGNPIELHEASAG